MNLENVREGAKLIRQGLDKFNSGPLDYYLTRLAACYEFLLTLAPHKVGDTVQLAKTPVITREEGWGWMGYKHFLKKGARAKVAEVRHDGKDFSYMLVFEDDSWIDHNSKEISREPEKRGHFLFGASYVAAVSET